MYQMVHIDFNLSFTFRSCHAEVDEVHRMNRPRRRLAGLGALATLLGLGLSAGPARAAEPDWPNRPIRLVVPQAAGSANDVLARTWPMCWASA
jgi:hypothetical protein